MTRRIVHRDALPKNMIHPRAASERDLCRQAITLDSTIYRCGRAVHDGIHDAFATHADGGEVRW